VARTIVFRRLRLLARRQAAELTRYWSFRPGAGSGGWVRGTKGGGRGTGDGETGAGAVPGAAGVAVCVGFRGGLGGALAGYSGGFITTMPVYTGAAYNTACCAGCV
jgi:hypothetical protein